MEIRNFLLQSPIHTKNQFAKTMPEREDAEGVRLFSQRRRKKQKILSKEDEIAHSAAPSIQVEPSNQQQQPGEDERHHDRQKAAGPGPSSLAQLEAAHHAGTLSSSGYTASDMEQFNCQNPGL